MNIISGILLTIVLAMCAIMAYLISRKKDISQENESLQNELRETRTTRDAVTEELSQTRSEKEWYRSLFTRSNDMVFIFELKQDNIPGQFIEVNDFACQRLGFSRDDFNRLSLVSLEAGDVSTGFGYASSELVVLSDDYIKSRQQKYAQRQTKALMDRLAATGEISYEIEFEDSKGGKFPVAAHAVMLNSTEPRVVMLTARDIAEQKHA